VSRVFKPDALDSSREALALFRALPGPMAVRDVQDLMAYPFFSLAKSKRVQPINFRAGGVVLCVEATVEHGLATIWDADVLIWAASQIVEARDAGVRTSRLMQATPYQILTFIGRGTSVRDYVRLKAALDRLQSTTIATSIRQSVGLRLHRFSWINEWKERVDGYGGPLGIELILPDWFYAGVNDETLASISTAPISTLRVASSVGSTGWCASTAAGSAVVGALTFATCTVNPAVSPASPISRSTCGTLRRDNHCLVTGYPSSARVRALSFSRSSLLRRTQQMPRLAAPLKAVDRL
jgi:Replication initiator protein A